MCARFTVLNETPIASAIAGCVIPLSRSSTIWMRSRCAAGIFHRSAVFNCRICFLVHLTIRPPESDSQSESYRVPSCETEKRQKSPDSNSYGSGISTSIGTSIRFGRANRGLLAEAPSDGGGGCIACDRNEVGECFSTCGHQPTNGANRPEARTGWCGDGRCGC